MSRSSSVALSRSLAPPRCVCFLVDDPSPSALYTLSLHDALPISGHDSPGATNRKHTVDRHAKQIALASQRGFAQFVAQCRAQLDRKSTRLNSSHLVISYAVFCLKKKIKLVSGAREGRVAQHVT